MSSLSFGIFNLNEDNGFKLYLEEAMHLDGLNYYLRNMLLYLWNFSSLKIGYFPAAFIYDS